MLNRFQMGYDKRVRPNYGGERNLKFIPGNTTYKCLQINTSGKPVDVDVNLDVVDLSDVSEIDMVSLRDKIEVKVFCFSHGCSYPRISQWTFISGNTGGTLGLDMRT